jgi:hypothetical protein
MTETAPETTPEPALEAAPEQPGGEQLEVSPGAMVGGLRASLAESLHRQADLLTALYEQQAAYRGAVAESDARVRALSSAFDESQAVVRSQVAVISELRERLEAKAAGKPARDSRRPVTEGDASPPAP